MIEPCYVLGLVCVMVPLGHGIWLLLAWFFRSMHGIQERPAWDGPRREHRCVGCGTRFDAAERVCPECLLDQRSKTAAELRDLEAAARSVQDLLSSGSLDKAACDQVYRGIEARQRVLLNGDAVASRVAADTVPAVLLQMEALLGGKPPEQPPSAEQNREILRGYRLLRDNDLQSLSATALLGLARLLAKVGLATRALNVYRALLVTHPGARDATCAGVEAGRLAFDSDQWGQTRWFLENALTRPGATEQFPDAVTLQEHLREWASRGSAEKAQASDVVPRVLLAPGPAAASDATARTDAAPPSARVEEAPSPPPTAAEPATPPAPRRSLAEWLAVFMEERNVLWGEVVGGMLIVGCSIALVISLWQTLERIPFFPFIILAALTGALLGAGFYTLSHWKLQSTSRGLLLIGMLLVPLNFLVLAGLSRDLQAGTLEIVTAGGALLFFGWLTRRAGRILVRDRLDEAGAHSDGLFVLTIVAAALTLLAVPHVLSGEDMSPWPMLLGLAPAMAQALALAMVLARLTSRPSWPGPVVRGLFVLVGVSSFASATALGFLLYSCQDLAAALIDLSLPVAILGAPLLVCGALVYRRATEPAAEAEAEVPSGLARTAGTGTALVGLLVLFAAFATALPDLWQRWLVGGINVAVVVATAWGVRLPLLHVPAVAYLIVLVHCGFRGPIDFTAGSPELAINLAILMALQIVAAEACVALRRPADSRAYAVGAAVTTALAAAWALAYSETHPGVAAGVLAAAGVAWLLFNRHWRSALVNYLALATLLGSTRFITDMATPGLTPVRLGLWSLLAHASLCVGLSVALGLTRAGATHSWLASAYCRPARMTAIAGSVVAALLLVLPLDAAGLSGWCAATLWLAVLWATLAFAESSALLVGAFHIALAASIVTGLLAWAQHLAWEPLEPRSLHLAGLGVAALGLFWESIRRWAGARAWALLFLPTCQPAMDRVILGGVVAGQALLAIAGALPAVAVELNLSVAPELLLPEEWRLQIAQPAAWFMLAVLAAGLFVAARSGNLAWPAHGLAILLLTMPVLIGAGWPAEEVAGASALRWGLATTFAVGSCVLWLHGPVERKLADVLPVASLRGVLVGGAVVPVLCMTCVVAGYQLQGEALPGPLPGSVFARMGGSLSLLLPLAAISATFAGHGFRERLARQLLAGGLLGVINLMAGRLIQPHAEQHGLLGDLWVQTLQLGTACAWLWAMGWLLVARQLDRDHAQSALIRSPLLTVQVCVGAVLFGLTMVGCGILAVMPFNEMPPAVLEAGAPAGWLLLGLVTVGVVFLAHGRGQCVAVRSVARLSFCVALTLACSAEPLGLSSRSVLMMALAALSVLWASADPWLLRQIVQRWIGSPGPGFGNTTTLPAVMAGTGAVLLAIPSNEPRLLPAAALALTALASALLAWHKRREGWALLSGPLLAAAASVVIWWAHFGEAFVGWAQVLIQTDLAVLGAISLLWLGARRRFYREALTLQNSPCLGVQTALGLAGTAPLLIWVLLLCIASPSVPDPSVTEAATTAGWLALILNLAALVWYVGLVAPSRVVHVVGVGGLLGGILAAAGVEAVLPIPWLAHHVLTGCWTMLSLAMLTAAWSSHRHEQLGPHLWTPERRAAVARLLRTWLPERVARGWVSGCAGAVVGLAVLAAWPEPNLPAWSSGNVLAISLLLGALAIWSRHAIYSYASGLMFNIVGFLLHAEWARARIEGAGPLLANGVLVGTFVSTQVLCFALAGVLWSLLERRLLRRTPAMPFHGLPSFGHAALLAGLHLLTVLIVLAVALQLAGLAAPIGEALAWCALLALAGAAIVCFVDDVEARTIRSIPHACCLLAVGLVAQAFPLTQDNGWYALLLVGACIVGSTATIRWGTRLPILRRLRKRHADEPNWLLGHQAILAILLSAVALAMSVSLAYVGGRLCAAGSAALAALTWWLLVGAWPQVIAADPAPESTFKWIRFLAVPRCMTLALTCLASVGLACATVDPDAATWWLESAAAVLAVCAGLAAAARGFSLRLDADHPWRRPLRAFGLTMTVAGYAATLLVIALLWAWFEPMPGLGAAPLPTVLILGAVLAEATLVGLSLHFALSADDDEFSVPASRRGVYVYAALALIAAFVLTVRLTVPQIIPPVLGRYWPLSVMVIAFIGVGLGEFFQCRRPVLAHPLRRTALVLALVPLLAYLLQLLIVPHAELGQRIGLLRPLVHFLDPVRLRGGVAMHALCWLLLGLLHGWVARQRESANQGLLAALFVNFSVWVLLGSRDELTFLTHPQLWLIPVGMILLAAEFINRRQLGPWPSTVLRSLALLCIYLSSTFDMLLTGLGNSVVLPIALALLSVLGAMLGILLRMRAPLLFGSAFLGVVIFAQIWHAAVDRQQTWVWWACGIVLGLAILALFAYFEKHRNKVLDMFEDIRHWT